MNKYANIIYHDLKNTQRDPTLLIMLMVPVLLIVFLRFAIPALTTIFPIVADFHIPIVAFFAILNSLFPGFIIAFILLDEKDLNLFPVIKVTPLSLSGILLARMLFIIILGIVSSLLIIRFNGLMAVDIKRSLTLCWLSALQAPIITLLISTFAKNKVEGLTYLKAANIIIFIPMAIWFIDSKWEILLSILPTYWPIKVIEGHHSTLYFIIGNFYLIILNYVCFKWAVSKN